HQRRPVEARRPATPLDPVCGLVGAAVARRTAETVLGVSRRKPRPRRGRGQAERRSGDLDVFRPDEIRQLVAAAECEQASTLYLTAAFSGLRFGELAALRWSDIDWQRDLIHVRRALARGAIESPKSGKVRSVPMVPDVARALARLGQR